MITYFMDFVTWAFFIKFEQEYGDIFCLILMSIGQAGKEITYFSKKNIFIVIVKINIIYNIYK